MSHGPVTTLKFDVGAAINSKEVDVASLWEVASATDASTELETSINMKKGQRQRPLDGREHNI